MNLRIRNVSYNKIMTRLKGFKPRRVRDNKIRRITSKEIRRDLKVNWSVKSVQEMLTP